MTTVRVSFAALAVGRKLYALGGYGGDTINPDELSSVEMAEMLSPTPSPTATNTPTAANTPTATATSTVTATPPRGAVYLPVVGRASQVGW